jgi:carboxylesterase
MAKKPIGVLILHGFAASLDSVKDLELPMRFLNLPLRMPTLRGHGARSPEALKGVDWRDWVADGEAAMRALLTEASKVLVIGHGMGSLVALTLAVNSRDNIDSLVLAAPPIAMPNPVWTQIRMQVLQPFVQDTFRRWPLPPSYTDKAMQKSDTNYHWAPMEAIVSFFEFIEMARGRLTDVRVPVLILQSKNDNSVSEEGADIIRKSISTLPADKHIRWFKKSGHELFRDCERGAAIEAVSQFVMERVDTYSRRTS